jgi:FtsH-binding integral membrane protein
MSQYYSQAMARPVAALDVDARATFISRTYMHLFGAIGLFTFLEIVMFQSGIAESIFSAIRGVSWLMVLGAFMLVSWLASRTAIAARSLAAQYAALIAYVVVWSVIFVPLLKIANETAKGGVIESAAVVTLGGFAALTMIAFMTRKDFSFLGGVLRWACVAAVLAIVAGLIFGFQLGTWFSVGMIVFAGAAILYDTSNILHHYPEDRYVAAALALFGSVALMFWYVIQLFLASRD